MIPTCLVVSFKRFTPAFVNISDISLTERPIRRFMMMIPTKTRKRMMRASVTPWYFVIAGVNSSSPYIMVRVVKNEVKGFVNPPTGKMR